MKSASSVDSSVDSLVGKIRIFVDSCSALSVESAHGLTWEEKVMSGGCWG